MPLPASSLQPFYRLLIVLLCLISSTRTVVAVNNYQVSFDLEAEQERQMSEARKPRAGLGRQGAAIPLDPNLYAPAPEALELRQVHIFVRHGERTPVSVRMAGPPASIPEHWIMCKTARRFRAAVASFSSGRDRDGVLAEEDEFLPLRRVVERESGASAEGECMLGELTDIGRETTYAFGTALRQLYIDRLGFLPDSLRRTSDVYFRSTNMPRTIESLQQVVHGLYPASKRAEDAGVTVLVRNGKDENLIGNAYACKRLEILLAGFAQAAATAWNRTLEPLDDKISKYIDGNPIRLDGKPRASGILDTIRAAAANGLKVPKEFEDKAVIDIIEKAVVNEWFAGYKTEEVRRLGMGRLLSDVSRKMAHTAAPAPTGKKSSRARVADDSSGTVDLDSYPDVSEEREPAKILIHSTHDTAIAGLCSTLDVYDEKWPPFTSSITFELFRAREDPSAQSYLQGVLGGLLWSRRNTSAEHFVRMRYQNRDLVLPACAEEGKHLPGAPQFCTLAAFRSRVAELTPGDWAEECLPAGRA